MPLISAARKVSGGKLTRNMLFGHVEMLDDGVFLSVLRQVGRVLSLLKVLPRKVISASSPPPDWNRLMQGAKDRLLCYTIGTLMRSSEWEAELDTCAIGL